MAKSTRHRHKARILAMQAIFQADVRGFETTTVDELGAFRWVDYPVPAEEQEFARVLIQAALENHKTIDALIKERLVNWELSRISAVSRAILRTGIAQLLYLKEEADDAVVIDEALLLTKQYDAIEAAAFINGLLDDIISYRDDKKERVLPKPKPLAQKIKIKSKLKRQI